MSNDVTVEEQATIMRTFLDGLVDAFDLDATINDEKVDDETIELRRRGRRSRPADRPQGSDPASGAGARPHRRAAAGDRHPPRSGAHRRRRLPAAPAGGARAVRAAGRRGRHRLGRAEGARADASRRPQGRARRGQRARRSRPPRPRARSPAAGWSSCRAAPSSSPDRLGSRPSLVEWRRAQQLGFLGPGRSRASTSEHAGRFRRGRGCSRLGARPGLGRRRARAWRWRPGGRTSRWVSARCRRASGGVPRRCRPAARARRTGSRCGTRPAEDAASDEHLPGLVRPRRRSLVRTAGSGRRMRGAVPAGRRAAGRERTAGHRRHPLAGTTGSNRLASRWSRQARRRTTHRSWCCASAGRRRLRSPAGRACRPAALVGDVSRGTRTLGVVPTFHVEPVLDREGASPQRCAVQ